MSRGNRLCRVGETHRYPAKSPPVGCTHPTRNRYEVRTGPPWGGLSDDAGQLVDHVRQPLVADPDPDDRATPGLDELSQPGRAGPDPPDAGDPVPDGRDHVDCAGPRGVPVGPAHRSPDHDVPARRLEQHPEGAAEGRARLRDRGVEEAAAGRHGRPGGLRPGAAGRSPPGAERAELPGRREHDRRGEHRPGGRRQAGPGGFPRGYGASDRDRLRRQREPR